MPKDISLAELTSMAKRGATVERQQSDVATALLGLIEIIAADKVIPVTPLVEAVTPVAEILTPIAVSAPDVHVHINKAKRIKIEVTERDNRGSIKTLICTEMGDND